jgi:outer membrane protein assembly factor BamB
MRPSPARLLAARSALALPLALALAACGSVTGQRAGTSAAVTPAQASPRTTVGQSACGPPPPRHAWAVDVTTAGRINWKTPLKTRGNPSGPAVSPVPVGPVAVFAQDGIVHGIRLADGHPLWSWPGGQDVYGLWRQGALVAVLTDQVSNHARLTGLDAATGAVRWSLRLPARGLLGGQSLTADGGLAMVVPGQGLQVVNLADGRVRWRLRILASPALTTAGGLVIYGLNGHLTGYDARTGRPRWAITPGVSFDPAFQLAGGLLLVTSTTAGPSVPKTLTAVVPATGRVAWRFDPHTRPTDPEAQASVLAAGPAGLAVATYDPRRLYLLDLRTGRPRWHAGTFVTEGAIPLVTRTSIILTEGQDQIAVVARDVATGRVQWRDPDPEAPGGYQPVLAAGPLAILQGDPGAPGGPGGTAPLRAYQAATGKLAWQANLPTFVQAPPVLVPGGILIQPADTAYACPAAFTTGAVTTDAGRTTAGRA